MEAILKEAELTGALTDLLMGVIIIPMIILLLKTKTDKKEQKTSWLWFFSVLDVSCFLGFTVHYFCKSEISKKIVWIPLYILLFEVFNCFFVTALSIFKGEGKRTEKSVVIIHLISLAGYVVSKILIYTKNTDSMRLLTVFNSVIAVAAFALILKTALKKGHTGERILFLAFLPLLPTLYLETKRNTLVKIIWYFDHNGLTHILIILSIIILFISVRVCLKEKNSKNNTITFDK